MNTVHISIPLEVYEALCRSLCRDLKNNVVLTEMIKQNGNAFEAFEEGVKNRFLLEKYAEKFFKIRFPFAERVVQTNTFLTMMRFLSRQTRYERKAFFKTFYALTPSLKNFEASALNWLETFSAEEENSYEYAIVFPMLLIFEKHINQEKYLEDTLSADNYLKHKVNTGKFLQEGLIASSNLHNNSI